ncbi:MAG: (d)CMP kinase [Bacteroidota bacterium]
MGKIIVAIDGHSSTGKSTIAKRLAQALDYTYVDTGAMYRAIAFFALENGIIQENLDTEKLIKALPRIQLSFEKNDQSDIAEICLDGDSVEAKIRNLKVSKWVSPVAAVKEVREKLVEMQQQIGLDKGVVMDGRDIGTVVFPQAELKIFMTASAETRAHRRYKELLDRGDEVTYEQVLKNVQERDFIDSTRSVSPLKKAKDAIHFDNSDMGLEEQFERIYNFAQRVIAKAS